MRAVRFGALRWGIWLLALGCSMGDYDIALLPVSMDSVSCELEQVLGSLFLIRESYSSGLLSHNSSNATDRMDVEGATDALLRRLLFAAMSSDARMMFIGFEDGTFGGYFYNGTFAAPSGSSYSELTFTCKSMSGAALVWRAN